MMVATMTAMIIHSIEENSLSAILVNARKGETFWSKGLGELFHGSLFSILNPAIPASLSSFILVSRK
jgi:hypothetical protein